MRRLLALVLLAACTRTKDVVPVLALDASPSGALPVAWDAGFDPADTDAGADAGPLFDDEAYRTRDPAGGKSIGHTSVVFKLKLEGGLVAAFKPRSRRGNTRYRGEVAAYRVARALDLDNVPRVLVRSFDADALRRALTASGAAPIFDQEVLISGSRVTGALIPWLPKLDFLPLEAEPWLSRWRGWLRNDAAIPSDQRALAAQISTMVVFDYLTGNWDRWSGGNVGLDGEHGALLYIDNDGAFYDVPPPAAMERQLGILRGVDRFSRHFVAALRALDREHLARAVGEESPGVPLLTPRALDGVDARRKRALETIDAKIVDGGGPATLAFE